MGKILLAVLAAAGLLRPDLPTRPVRPGFEPSVETRPGGVIEHLDGLVRLPPLVTPGEAIEITPLNPAKTPPGGRWTVAGVEARPVEPVAGSEPGLPRLRVQLPASLDPMGPLPVVYVDAKGRRIVEASGLEQVRVVPQASPPASLRLSRCGSQWVQDGVACACGWFPDQAARDAFRIDGRPAVPMAVSLRSVCARVGLGPHRISGALAAGFEPVRDDKVVAVQIRRFPPFLSLRPLQSTSITWMVLGTKEPVRLRLRNTAPDLATLEGGTLQTVVTSGGLRNAASRNVTWLAGSGPFRIEAEVEDGTAPFLGEEYLTLLGEHFQREVRRMAADLDGGVRALPEGRNGSLYPRSDVLSLLTATQTGLSRALPYPELAAFRDATADLLDDAAARVQLLPEEEAGAYVEKKKVQPLLKRVQGFLESSGESPRRSLCILSSPEEGAIVKIYPRSLPSDPVETSTADIVSHLFPGKYRYEVWKDSFKEVESEIDLTGTTEDARMVLDCRLIPAGDRDRPAPCRLASASERDAARCRWP
jgi:hypothetical protein